MFGALAEYRPPEGPILAIAAHDGHSLRPDLQRWIRLGEESRRREEDPWTGAWTEIGDGAIIVRRSRFEVDVNRPRELALYRRPEDAWGLGVWDERTPEQVFEDSLALYDAFYRDLRVVLEEQVVRYGRGIVLDLHSYNHRRQGPEAPPDDPAGNPTINLGTGTMDRSWWAPLVDRWLRDIRNCAVGGEPLDVRENVRFVGGFLPRWIHMQFPRTICALAIEIKKVFMDEWTGALDRRRHAEFGAALKATLPGLRQELERLR